MKYNPKQIEQVKKSENRKRTKSKINKECNGLFPKNIINLIYKLPPNIENDIEAIQYFKEFRKSMRRISMTNLLIENNITDYEERPDSIRFILPNGLDISYFYKGDKVQFNKGNEWRENGFRFIDIILKTYRNK